MYSPAVAVSSGGFLHRVSTHHHNSSTVPMATACLLHLQVLLCIFLFSVALFITTVIAKLLASYFHKQAFFDKMQETLKQVAAVLRLVTCPTARVCTPRVLSNCPAPKGACTSDSVSACKDPQQTGTG
jgi:hypothetical protein